LFAVSFDTRAQFQLDDLAVAVDSQWNIFAEVGDDFVAPIRPCRILLIVEGDNPVAFLQPGLFSGRTRRDFADHDLLRVIDVGLKADQDRSRRDQKRSNDVEGGTSDGHQEALPFRLREEFVNRAFALPLHQLHILAAEFNVTSEWNRAETVIGIAESKTEQA